jgi:predicted DNA-binding transcriptional regulator AlpA
LEASNQNQLVRISEVGQLLSLGKSTIRLWVAQGKLPEPITLSPTIKVWRMQDLLEWIDLQARKPSTVDASTSHTLDSLSISKE